MISLNDQTVVLGEEAHFFCQVLGKKTDLRVRINGRLLSLPFINPHDLIITVEESSQVIGGRSFNNISITIVGTKERNQSRIECYDVTMIRNEVFSTATLTVRGRETHSIPFSFLKYFSGGPAEPEVKYEISQDQREILLSWSRPFTWSDYPITGYLIECRDSEKTVHSSAVNDTETVSGAVVSQTVELPSHTPDCYSLNCSVAAYNDLDHSSLTLKIICMFTVYC